VNVYETDEEKIEAIKAWWKENAVSVIGGMVIGLMAVFGWRYWQSYQENLAQQASTTFEQLVANVEAGNSEVARRQAALILQKHGDSAYTALTHLVLARLEIAAQQPAAARQALPTIESGDMLATCMEGVARFTDREPLATIPLRRSLALMSLEKNGYPL